MNSNLRVLFISSEVYPFAKTGGLADVAGSLPQALIKFGYEVAISLPLYKIIPGKFSLEKLVEIEVAVGEEIKKGYLCKSLLGEIPVFLIAQEEYFNRENLYGDENGDYPDNLERFSFFCRAALAGIKRIKWEPEIIHCNDWQTALIPLYLKALYSQDDFFKKTGSLFTIHNLAYQGIFPREKLKLTGLGEEFFVPDKLEFYGKINVMKAGLIYSDLVNTVSPTYSQEIQTPEYGFGLDGVLRERKNVLYGILNGIDYQVWDPSKDEQLIQNYSLENPEGKKDNKKALQKENNLPCEDVLLVGLISRLADQKGLDLVAGAIEEMMQLPLQFILLGTGDKHYHKIFDRLGKKFPRQTGIHLCFDPSMARRIYAGADVFLMPSRYEPCGLGQMISLRYGTIPVVRKTGGLADTVREFNPLTEEGNGFLFESYSSSEMLAAIKRALGLYIEKDKWGRLIRNAMKEDFSWDRSAKEYAKLYQKIRGL